MAALANDLLSWTPLVLKTGRGISITTASMNCPPTYLNSLSSFGDALSSTIGANREMQSLVGVTIRGSVLGFCQHFLLEEKTKAWPYVIVHGRECSAAVCCPMWPRSHIHQCLPYTTLWCMGNKTIKNCSCFGLLHVHWESKVYMRRHFGWLIGRRHNVGEHLS